MYLINDEIFIIIFMFTKKSHRIYYKMAADSVQPSVRALIGGVLDRLFQAAYDPEYTQRFWSILTQASRVFTEFRCRFTGKVSPVHFFWGAFNLAVSRFSGRTAPLHPGTPNCPRFVMVEAYSHEVSSCGFWPGGGLVDEPAFYSYAYPEPQGFKDYHIQPPEAFYHMEMGEFVLPYEVVRTAKSPDEVLLAFLQSTYEAAATRARRDRRALERH